MSMENANQQLDSVGYDVSQLAAKAVQVTEDRRFATIPDLCQEASRKAGELTAVLQEIHDRAREYAEVARGFDATGLESTGGETINRFKQRVYAVAGESENPLFEDLLDVITRMGGNFTDTVYKMPRRAQACASHISRVKRIASSMESLANQIRTSNQETAEKYWQDSTEVTTIIHQIHNPEAS
jgi:hypothetical protein